jgi:hypothetical protein
MRVDRLNDSVNNDARLEVGNQVLGKGYRGQLDDLRIYRRSLKAEEIQQLAVQNPIRALLSLDTSNLSESQAKSRNAKLQDCFLTYDASEPYRKLYSELKELRKQKAPAGALIDFFAV